MGSTPSKFQQGEKPVFNFFFTVRGGLNELYRCMWNQDWKSSCKQQMLFYDLISAYTFAAFGLFPVGNYEVSFSLILQVCFNALMFFMLFVTDYY